MDIKVFYKRDGEKPLDNLVNDGGFCGIFRRIACVGDSLSSGEFEGTGDEGQRTWHDLYDYSWGQYLARMAGCTVLNFSRGGMSAKQYCDTFAAEKGFWDADKACQAYIIALGVNDVSAVLNGGIEFGELSDIDPEDCENNAPTFIGYYGKIISKYKAIEPEAKFFIMTMPREKRDMGRQELYDKFREVAYGLAELFDNTYVLDLREYGPEYDEEFRDNFYLGYHMNAAGYMLTAKMVASYIDFIIRNNPNDFRKVGFIGTPYKNDDVI